jgi:hypothetical protein
MSDLSPKSRAALPKKAFGLPAERKYPMQNKSHAANAKSRAAQEVDAGKLSEGAKAKIDAKADKVLGEKPASKKPESIDTFMKRRDAADKSSRR